MKRSLPPSESANFGGIATVRAIIYLVWDLLRRAKTILRFCANLVQDFVMLCASCKLSSVPEIVVSSRLANQSDLVLSDDLLLHDLFKVSARFKNCGSCFILYSEFRIDD